MVGTAAGLAITGHIPFVGTFAEFATGRVYDQLRQSVCYSGANVKIAASHAGITLGEDGATHQTMEDIALTRALPHMTVINPCDFNQTRLATLAAAAWEGPVYLRFGRPSVPNFTPVDGPFEIGKAWMVHPGEDITLLATGHLVWALKPLNPRRSRDSGRMINIHHRCWMHRPCWPRQNRRCGYGEALGGGRLGEAVAGLLAQHHPVHEDGSHGRGVRAKWHAGSIDGALPIERSRYCGKSAGVEKRQSIDQRGHGPEHSGVLPKRLEQTSI